MINLSWSEQNAKEIRDIYHVDFNLHENLDGMSIAPTDVDEWARLAELRLKHGVYGGDLPKQVRTKIAYARLKAEAMRSRLGGDLTTAMVHEQKCDGLYKQLPQNLRW